MNGVRGVLLQHALDALQRYVPLAGPIFTVLVVVVGGIAPWVRRFRVKRAWSTVDTVMDVLRLVAIPVIIAALLQRIGVVGSASGWLFDPAVLPFAFDRVIVPVALIVFLSSVLLTFVTGYGLPEFLSALLRPVMRPFLRLPGAAAFSAVTSLVGGYAVTIFMTDRLQQKGVYTQREGAVVVTGLATLSVAFMIVIARTAGLVDLWGFYLLSTLAVTYLVTAITARIPPLRTVRDKATTESEPGPREAWQEGLSIAGAAPGFLRQLSTNTRQGFVKTLTLAPAMASVVLIAVLLVRFTPVFDLMAWILRPVVALLALLGMPDHVLMGKAAAVAFAEVFVPNLLVVDAPIAVRYVIGVISVSGVVFLAGPVPCILSTSLRVRVVDLLIVWLERMVLSLLFAGGIALVVF